VIGVGDESTLAAPARFVQHAGLLQPAGACAKVDMVRTFPVLPGIEHLTILADADAKSTGQDAARACAKRWAEAGCEVEVLIPDEIGADFNDLVMRGAP